MITYRVSVNNDVLGTLSRPSAGTLRRLASKFGNAVLIVAVICL